MIQHHFAQFFRGYLAIALSVFIALPSLAQEQTCGTDRYNRLMKEQHPSFAIASQEIDRQIREYIAQNPGSGSRSVITIPVVFHLLYDVNIKNISDAQILSQLDVLNEDFRLANSNFETMTPEVFKPLAADIGIEFCLAKTDPQGNPTTGINRRQSPVSTFSNDDNKMKYANQGGIDAWPSDRYLNIWICDLQSPVLGFAQFPGGPASSDGVVLHYKVVGRAPANPYITQNNLGRTASHEVGHWLGLYHIWGEAEGCTDTDEVDDTPPQNKANFGCPSFPAISCNNGPNGDMFVNYMDYTDDACHTMFTHGQKQRIHALFAPGGHRESLLTSTACFTGVEPEQACSDTLRYPFSGTLTKYQISMNGSGYQSGTNSRNDKAKAEFFSASGLNRQVKGAWFRFAVASQGSAPAGTQVNFKVWSNTGTGQSPGDILASASIPLSQIISDVANQRNTWVPFPEKPHFGNGFFVGFELASNPGYELALYTNQDGQSIPATAWEQTHEGQWQSFDIAGGWNLKVSHAVFPFIEVPDLMAEALLNDESICVGQGVIFSSAHKADYYHWRFPGGNPAESDSASAYVTYANPGNYAVELNLASACYSDTVKAEFNAILQVIANPGTPFLEYDGAKLFSSITSGTFKWYRNNNLIPGANQYFIVPTQNGTYRVTVTQSGCSSSSAPFEMDILGIDAPENSLKIYPNPSNGLINIVLPSDYNQVNSSFQVFDLGGKVLSTARFFRSGDEKKIELNLQSLDAGVYLLRCVTGTRTFDSKLLILPH